VRAASTCKNAGVLLLDDLRVVLAVQRAGRLALAARELGVDATTVGRRLAAAEAALGARLFTRSRDGLRPTAAGRRAVDTAERTVALVGALERSVARAEEQVEGTVRVTSSDGLLVHALAPALPALLARHPRLQLELLGSTRPLDLLRGEAELAVRLFRPRERGLVARRAGSLSYGLFASPAYLASAGAPRSLADLAGHAVVGYDASLAATPEMRWLARNAPAAMVRVRASGLPVLLAACRAAAGVALVPTRFAACDPLLERVLPRVPLFTREAWLLMHPDLRRSAPVAAVAAWVVETLASEPPAC
jgi:DNA-binding transcriptional LysR family regulator